MTTLHSNNNNNDVVITKIHQLHKEYHAKTLAPVSAVQMAPYFATDFQTLQAFYASLDPPIIPNDMEHSENLKREDIFKT